MNVRLYVLVELFKSHAVCRQLGLESGEFVRRNEDVEPVWSFIPEVELVISGLFNNEFHLSAVTRVDAIEDVTVNGQRN